MRCAKSLLVRCFLLCALHFPHMLLAVNTILWPLPFRDSSDYSTDLEDKKLLDGSFKFDLLKFRGSNNAENGVSLLQKAMQRYERLIDAPSGVQGSIKTCIIDVQDFNIDGSIGISGENH